MAILSENSLGFDIQFVVVDHDPSKISTDCPKGSLICQMPESEFGKPVYFYKLDEGATLNVQRIILRHNFSASSAPTATDDVTTGFDSGSMVYDGSNLYVCVNGTPGAAVWKQVDG